MLLLLDFYKYIGISSNTSFTLLTNSSQVNPCFFCNLDFNTLSILLSYLCNVDMELLSFFYYIFYHLISTKMINLYFLLINWVIKSPILLLLIPYTS
jgi:hypothetical protein